jgi:5-methylcytosine-specific restriction endonuclease McrA
VFGRLTVNEELGLAGKGYRWWGCSCACGERVAVRSRELDRGHTQSCGCLFRESRTGGHNRLPYGHASRNELLASYRKSARDRGLSWDLSNAEFFALVTSNCRYCGTPPNSVRKPNAGVNGEFFYTGVDRVENTLGYIPDNVVSCCWDCNRAKGMMTIAAFESWLDRIVAARAARFEHGESGAPL